MSSPSDSRIESRLVFLNKWLWIPWQEKNQGFDQFLTGILSKWRASGIPCYRQPHPLLYQKAKQNKTKQKAPKTNKQKKTSPRYRSIKSGPVLEPAPTNGAWQPRSKAAGGVGRPKPAESWRRPAKGDTCLLFGSDVEFAIPVLRRCWPRSTPGGPNQEGEARG